MSFLHTSTTRRRTAVVLALLTACAGCGDLLKQPYPAKGFYGIEPGTPDVAMGTVSVRPDGYINRDGNVVATSRPTAGSIMLVRPLRVVAPYDGLAFVYRDGPAAYTTDYYNNFVATPSALLSGGLIEWLERAGPMPVVATGSTVRSDLVLDGSITKLLIDRTDRVRPKAVIAAHFIVTRDAGNGSPIVSDTAYSVDVPVAADTPAGYAEGWGKGWRQILQRLGDDLRSTVGH